MRKWPNKCDFCDEAGKFPLLPECMVVDAVAANQSLRRVPCLSGNLQGKRTSTRALGTFYA